MAQYVAPVGLPVPTFPCSGRDERSRTFNVTAPNGVAYQLAYIPIMPSFRLSVVFFGRATFVVTFTDSLFHAPRPYIRDLWHSFSQSRKTWLVGVQGFEPWASCSQSKRSDQTELHPDKQCHFGLLPPAWGSLQ
jgi:hypothetical protein